MPKLQDQVVINTIGEYHLHVYTGAMLSVLMSTICDATCQYNIYIKTLDSDSFTPLFLEHDSNPFIGR